MHKYITITTDNYVTITNKNIHPLSADIYVHNSHILHACMFKMAQSNHRGSSATGERRRSEDEQWGKNECNEAETECKDKQKRQSREGQRERERVWKVSFLLSIFLLPLLFLFFLTYSICSNVHIRNQ